LGESEEEQLEGKAAMEIGAGDGVAEKEGTE